MNTVNPRWMILTLILLPGLAQAAELVLTEQQLANANLATATVTTRESHPRLNLPGTLRADRRKSYRVAPVVLGSGPGLFGPHHPGDRRHQRFSARRCADPARQPARGGCNVRRHRWPRGAGRRGC